MTSVPRGDSIDDKSYSTSVPGRRRSISAKRTRSRSHSRKRRTSSGGADMEMMDSVAEDLDRGYFSEPSEGADESEIVDEPSTGSSHGHKPKNEGVARLKRTLSGKLRGNSSKVHEGPPPVNDSLHKSITSGMSPKQFAKVLRRASHIDQMDSKGQSAMHLCAARGMTDSLRALIKKGANVNLQDKFGYTPLHCAVIERKLRCCHVLLETKNVDVSITNNENSNILHYLVRVPVEESNLVEYREVLDLIIEKGIDVNQGNKHQEAPIHFACMKSNSHAVAFLLERGADCNSKTALGETPLHYAVRSGSIKLVRLLMQNGADPTAQADDDRVTPVDVAEQYQLSDILDFLHSIIEEELMAKSNTSMQSHRNRINESTLLKEGKLEVFVDIDWETLNVQLNKERIVCYHESSPAPICSIKLTNAEVTSEEGSIISDDEEQLWCFSVIEGNNTLSFATSIPEEREEWIESIDKVIAERQSLFSIYQKLKLQSKSRKRLRVRERQIAMENCTLGIQKIKASKNGGEFCKLLKEHPVYLSAALCTIFSTDNSDVFKKLATYLTQTDQFVAFMKEALTHEIRTTVMGETLFREMSLCTRLLSAYLEMEDGKEYLKSTVLGLLNDISSNEQVLELNPHAMTGDSKSVNVQANLEKIVQLSQNFLDRVLSSPNRCPLEFRELMLHTRKRIDNVFPNMTHAVVGGFVFLRFICPAIIAPHKFGLAKNMEMARREAVLITKILQTVSNGVEFDGTKEDYMQKLNPFIKKNRLFVDIFFDALTDPISIEKQRQSSSVSKRISDDELDSLEVAIFENVNRYQEKMDKLLKSKSSICIWPDSGSEETEISIVECDSAN